MSKGVTGDALLDSGFAGGVFDGSLEARWIEVVAAVAPIRTFPHFKSRNGGRGRRARVEGAFWGGEEVLPDQFGGGVWVFPLKGIREVNSSEAGGQVFFMKESDAFDLALKVRVDGVGHGGDAILFAFAIADYDGFVFEVDVFDAESDTLH